MNDKALRLSRYFRAKYATEYEAMATADDDTQP